MRLLLCQSLLHHSSLPSCIFSFILFYPLLMITCKPKVKVSFANSSLLQNLCVFILDLQGLCCAFGIFHGFPISTSVGFIYAIVPTVSLIMCLLYHSPLPLNSSIKQFQRSWIGGTNGLNSLKLQGFISKNLNYRDQDQV